MRNLNLITNIAISYKNTLAYLIIISISLIFFLNAISLGAEIEVKSIIKQVTIYPDSAVVTRVANLKAEVGEHKVIFPNIIPDVDENSLRVSFDGDAEAKVFGAQLKKEFLKEAPSERLQQIKDQIQKLQDEIKILENQKQLLAEKKDFLDSIRLFSKEQIPKDLVTKMPSIKELEETLSFLETKLKENYNQLMECDIKIRDLKKIIEVLQKELEQISGPAKQLKRTIEVDLSVRKAGTINLFISYLVRGVWWRPIYDARANFEKSAIELISYGVVKQTTGEDWADVEVFLSTAKPTIYGKMPEVFPWILRPLPPIPIRREKAQVMPMLAVPEEKEDRALEKPEVEYATPEEKGGAVVYKLPRKVNIKADGSEHRLPISSQLLSAQFEYSAYPRIMPYSYLMSRVINAPELQLLAGRVNIFLEGDYIGTSDIGNIGPGEEFDLYLGVDEQIKVKREQIEKKVEETSGANPIRRITCRYKLTVENNKTRKIKFKLFESMPVSEDERIKVKIEKVSLEPTAKDWMDKKGVWLWDLELAPKEKKEIFYTFTITYPRDLLIEGI